MKVREKHLIDLFYKSNANKMNFIKFIKIALIILFAFFIAVLPAVRAYASSVLIGALVGGLLGTAVGTALGAAGCTVIVAVLAGMCVSIGGSALYALCDDADFQTSFLQEWDNLTQEFQYRVLGATVLCSGAGFRALYNLVKTKIVDHFATTVSPELNGNYPLFNPNVVPYQFYIKEYGRYFEANGNSDIITFNIDDTNHEQLQVINSFTNWESTISIFRINGQCWYFYEDSNYHIKFKGADFSEWGHKKRTSFCPFITVENNNYCLYFLQGCADLEARYFCGDLTPCNFISNYEIYFTNNYNTEQTSNDIALFYERVGYSHYYKIYYLDSNNVKHYYRVTLPDGTVLNDFYLGGPNFFYYILCNECTLTDVTSNSIIVDSNGSVSTTINNYYSEKKDTLYNYYNQIASAESAGTLATGTNEDVKISTASLANSIAGTETIAETTFVTDVQSAVETTTGETITLSPSIMCMNGINLIRVTTGSVRNKFPFAVVYVLRDSFNVLQATRETPIFTIPLSFHYGNILNYDYDLRIDLSNLNTIAAITRWGDVGALVICLAILTKKMLF
jgi:hypothetical protein